MLTLVQLADGKYRLTLDYSQDGSAIHAEWIFAVTESDAEPAEHGYKLVIRFE